MNVNLFKTDEHYQLHSLKIGFNGFLVYSNFHNPKDLVYLRLDVWCFHLNEAKCNVKFPMQLDSIALTKMQCNDGYLIVLKSRGLILKLNLSEPPSKFEQPFEFQQGVHLASPVSTDTILPEFDMALNWLLLSKENLQLPLPGLPAIEVLSDSLLHYLNNFSVQASNYGNAHLKTLIGRYMKYEISEALYWFELKKLKSIVNR